MRWNKRWNWLFEWGLRQQFVRSIFALACRLYRASLRWLCRLSSARPWRTTRVWWSSGWVRLAEDASLQAGNAPSAPGDLDAALGVLTGSGYLAGVADQAGKVTPLAEMKVDELRELALQMGIPEAAKLKKAELVTAIAATEVQYPVKDEQSSGQNGEQ